MDEGRRSAGRSSPASEATSDGSASPAANAAAASASVFALVSVSSFAGEVSASSLAPLSRSSMSSIARAIPAFARGVYTRRSFERSVSPNPGASCATTNAPRRSASGPNAARSQLYAFAPKPWTQLTTRLGVARGASDDARVRLAATRFL